MTDQIEDLKTKVQKQTDLLNHLNLLLVEELDLNRKITVVKAQVSSVMKDITILTGDIQSTIPSDVFIQSLDSIRFTPLQWEVLEFIAEFIQNRDNGLFFISDVIDKIQKTHRERRRDTISSDVTKVLSRFKDLGLVISTKWTGTYLFTRRGMEASKGEGPTTRPSLPSLPMLLLQEMQRNHQNGYFLMDDAVKLIQNTPEWAELGLSSAVMRQRISNAFSYLKKLTLVKMHGRGVYSLTEKGSKIPTEEHLFSW